MKKTDGILLLLFAVSAFTVPALAIDHFMYEEATFSCYVAGEKATISGRVHAFDQFGVKNAELSWNGSTKTVTSNRGAVDMEHSECSTIVHHHFDPWGSDEGEWMNKSETKEFLEDLNQSQKEKIKRFLAGYRVSDDAEADNQ